MVECPYCKCENDMSDALSDGLSNDNTLDWECEGCEEEFEIHVEFDPSFSACKIDYADCEECKTETRDPSRKGKMFPWPVSLKSEVVCMRCFYKGMDDDYKIKDAKRIKELTE